MTLEGAGSPPCSKILLPALPRARASRSRGHAVWNAEAVEAEAALGAAGMC